MPTFGAKSGLHPVKNSAIVGTDRIVVEPSTWLVSFSQFDMINAVAGDDRSERNVSRLRLSILHTHSRHNGPVIATGSR
ncbi:hypothetical protein NJB1507_08440 [Mycobacterium marinum]|nr:hypothetical protein NJB1507_08440 [Mycobacterium marinum]